MPLKTISILHRQTRSDGGLRRRSRQRIELGRVQRAFKGRRRGARQEARREFATLPLIACARVIVLVLLAAASLIGSAWLLKGVELKSYAAVSEYEYRLQYRGAAMQQTMEAAIYSSQASARNPLTIRAWSRRLPTNRLIFGALSSLAQPQRRRLKASRRCTTSHRPST